MVQDSSYQKRHSIKCWVVALLDASRIWWGIVYIKFIRIGLIKFERSFFFKLMFRFQPFIFGSEAWNQNLFHLPTGPHSPQERFRNDFHQIEGHHKNVQDVPIHLLQTIEWKKFDWLVVGEPRPGGKDKRVKSKWWLNQPFLLYSYTWICTHASRDDHKISFSPSDSS